MSSAKSVTTSEGSVLWTLEEIGRLISQSGNPAETLTNIVHLIQRRFETDVCSVYLLEPDRANLVLAATIGLRPESVGRVRMRLDRGAGRAGRRAAASRMVVADATHASALQVLSARPAKIPTARSSACRSIDRGLLQGVLVVQTIEPRAFAPDDVRMLVDGRHAARADRQRGARARAVRRAGAPAARARWRRTCGGAGTTTPTSLFRELDPALWRECRPQSGRAAAADSDRPARGARLASSRCTAASTTPTAGCRSTCTRRTPGARGTPACCGRGRSPTSRPSSACTSRCRSTPAASASWPAITSRAPPTSASRWSASASTTTRATSGSGSTPTAGSTRTTSTSTTAQLPIRAGQRRRRAGHRRDRDPHRHDRRARLAAGRRPQHAAAARLERRGQPAGGPRADRAALRRRRARPHPPGAAARRRRRARARGAGHLARRRCTSTRGTARSPRWSWCGSGWRPRASTPGRRSAASSAQVVFTTHTPVPAGHDRFSSALIEEHSGRCARRCGLSLRRVHGPRPRQPATTTAKTFCMTVLALKLSRRANAVSSLHGQVSRAMWTAALSRIAARSACRSATSPTASTSRPGWRRRCGRSTTATSGPTGRSDAGEPGFWEAIDDVDDGELWETHQTLKARLIDFARRRAVRAGRAPRRAAGVRRAAAARA